jgi:hypothetical protein
MARHDVLASGIVSGVAGGVAMVVIAMIGAGSEDIAPMRALELIGETFVGADALSGSAKLAFGALVHLCVSVAFGIVLAGILPADFPVASAIGVGVGFALFALGLMISLVVPWANPGFRGGMQDIGGTWVIAHAVFGATLGTAPMLRRWLARGASEPAALSGPGVAARARPAPR